MELHIKDRLLIPSMLPAQNSFMEFNLKKSILKKVQITEQDKQDYKISENTKQQRIEWDVKKDKEVPLCVEFTTEELQYLTKACESMAEESREDEVWEVVEHIYNAASN